MEEARLQAGSLTASRQQLGRGDPSCVAALPQPCLVMREPTPQRGIPTCPDAPPPGGQGWSHPEWGWGPGLKGWRSGVLFHLLSQEEALCTLLLVASGWTEAPSTSCLVEWHQCIHSPAVDRLEALEPSAWC